MRRLADALAAQRALGYREPLQLTGAKLLDDDIAHLSAQVRLLAEHAAGQAQALDREARARQEWLAKVAHDLRTPLASLQGYLELLLLRQDSLDRAERNNYLQTAVRQSERLARLVRDLFELSRLESGETQAQGEDFALAELVQDVAQRFALEASQRQVQLRTDASAPAVRPLQVHADIGLVERVLVGLVENALRHTPAGGSVVIEQGLADRRATVEVRDTGRGITAAELGAIFEHYRHSDRVNGHGGSGHGGLGLAIARRIVALHRGELAIESEPGRGTRVRFDLPLASAAAGTPSPTAAVQRR
jgi:signal transduction histidine kinase